MISGALGDPVEDVAPMSFIVCLPTGKWGVYGMDAWDNVGWLETWLTNDVLLL